jgi:NitT/TauT family transport system ATP-binding protein
MSLLEMNGVSKIYRANGREIVALLDLNLHVEQSEFVVILGPSGCGKSTLLQIVAGLEPISAGQVLLAGRTIQGWGAERTLIFQRPNLFPWLTALENVAFGLRLAGHSATARTAIAHGALERMGLAETALLYPHELSGGMQQRVALARALVLDPAILLMDEPLASVDILERSRLQHEIYATCRGKTVLFVTHSIRESLVLADRLVILSPGPGRVRHEVCPPGPAPRALSSELLELELHIEQDLLSSAPR